MGIALALAARGLGNAWPNPAVGCVLERGGAIVGRGWTQPGGRPHAEAEALGRAGAAAKGATAYITLEPCAHLGGTPPCAEALIAAGVRRAVVALRDPDPRVNGRGIDRLMSAGVEVVTGVRAEEAEEVNAGFLSRIRRNRPMVTLKLATTLDGRIATRAGESQWITGQAAREAAHLLRARNDAVLVGSGTALADDPKLTCRLPGLDVRSPVRVLVDGVAALPETHHLIAAARRYRTIAVVADANSAKRRSVYEPLGVELIEVGAGRDGRPVLGEALAKLAGLGVTRLLVEGGAGIAASLLRERLVDRLIWFRAPLMVGGDGLAAAAGFGVDKLDTGAHFKLISVHRVGEDLMETYGAAG